MLITKEKTKRSQKQPLKRINTGLVVDVKRLMIDTMHLSPSELGRLMVGIFKSLDRGNFNIPKYRWIVKIIKGYQKRSHIPMDVRRRVLSVQECAYCGCKERLTVDHIIPVTKGGSNDYSNLQCLCFLCNVKKSDKL